MRFEKIQKMSDTEYLIKHKQDAKKDLKVTIEVDEEGRQVYFEGLPNGAEMYIA